MLPMIACAGNASYTDGWSEEKKACCSGEEGLTERKQGNMEGGGRASLHAFMESRLSLPCGPVKP